MQLDNLLVTKITEAKHSYIFIISTFILLYHVLLNCIYNMKFNNI